MISYEHYEFRWVHYSDVLFMLHHEQAKNYYAKRSPERIILMTNHPSHTRKNRVIDLYLIDKAITRISENGDG